MDALLHSPLWEKHVIPHQVEVANGLGGVLPPQHAKTQLDARHIIQVKAHVHKQDPTYESLSLCTQSLKHMSCVRMNRTVYA